MSTTSTDLTALTTVNLDYPWADVVIDLRLDPVGRLPQYLEPTLGLYDSNSRTPLAGSGFRVIPARDNPQHANTRMTPTHVHDVMLRVTSPAVGDSIALVWSQAATVEDRSLGFSVEPSIEASHVRFLLGIDDPRAFVTRGETNPEVAHRLEGLVQIGRLLRGPDWADTTRLTDGSGGLAGTVWADRARSRETLLMMLCGVTTPADVACLQANRVTLRAGRKATLNKMTSLTNALKSLTAPQVGEWWDTILGSGLRVAETAIRHGVPVSELRRWQRYPAMSVGHEDLGPAHLNEKFAALKVAIDQQWTEMAFESVCASTPRGCTDFVWMHTWTRFMPAEWAGAYAAAGFNLDEAARLHIKGEDPPWSTLVALGALRS